MNKKRAKTGRSAKGHARKITKTHNDTHHSTNGAPSEGHNEEEQERQAVDDGEDIQAREGHYGANDSTKEKGEGDEQGTRARVGGGGDGGEM